MQMEGWIQVLSKTHTHMGRCGTLGVNYIQVTPQITNTPEMPTLLSTDKAGTRDGKTQGPNQNVNTGRLINMSVQSPGYLSNSYYHQQARRWHCLSTLPPSPLNTGPKPAVQSNAEKSKQAPTSFCELQSAWLGRVNTPPRTGFYC